jgi:hypothetical protein
MSYKASLNVLKEIANLNATKNSVLYFYFSGHGFSTGGNDYLTCWDTDEKDPMNTSISTSLLIDAINQSGVGTAIIAFDACRKDIGKGFAIGSFGQQTAEIARRKGIIAFLSCMSGEYSWELREIKHSVFTYAFVCKLGLLLLASFRPIYFCLFVCTALSIQSQLHPQPPSLSSPHPITTTTYPHPPPPSSFPSPPALPPPPPASHILFKLQTQL